MAILALPLTALPAQAQYATAGNGRFTDSIFWFEWNGAVPNTGTVQTNTTRILDKDFVVECRIQNMARPRGTQGGDWLTPYRPGGYSGDMLDDLYNRGGTNANNTMPVGLYTQQANTVEFDFNCSATLGGQPFPLDGLVMADAESTAFNESISATIAPTGTWRILDRARSTQCANLNHSILATRTATATANKLTLNTTAECAQGSPVNVAYMDGVTAATKVTVAGGGREAIALGVVASFEGSDAPLSYGPASHGLRMGFTGGEIPVGPAVRTNDAAFALATPVLPSLRLGTAIDPDVQPLTSALADGDDRDVQAATGNVDDEDAVPSNATITVVPGQRYSAPITCTGVGTVAGWLDWDRNGTFDADERTQAPCTTGTATLVYTVPADAVSTPAGAASFLRLRTSTNSADLAGPSGVAVSGEVEDHTVRVIVPQPSATPDSATTAFETEVSLPVLANDVAGGSPFVPASVRLLQDGNPVPTLTTDQGSYRVDEATGQIVFTPAPGFVGETPAVPYRVSDEAGRSADSTVTVLVRAPGAPVANDDASTGDQGAVQRVAPLANDTPGVASVPLVPSTLALLDANGAPATTVTVPGQGVYAIAGADITFTPEPAFTGTASGVRYSVADSRAVVATARYVPTVVPVAIDDSSAGRQGVPQDIPVIDNDAATGADLDPATLQLVDPATGNLVTTVTVPGEGTWSVRNGALRFAPEPRFIGNTTALDYRVLTTGGDPVQATVTATVTGVVPTAASDSTTGPQGIVQSVDPFTNDAPGDASVPLNRASLTLLNAAGEPVASVAVEGGRYAVSGETLTFTPNPTFTGIAPAVQYRIADANGTTATSTYSAIVRTVVPLARGDVSEGIQGAPQRIDPFANDAAGDPAVPIDRGSLTLVNGAGQPVASTTVAGVGTWSVDGEELLFAPEPAYIGTPAPVTYRFADANGTLAAAPWSVEVTPGVAPDTNTGLQGQRQEINVLANDNPDVVPATLQLVNPAGGALANSVVVAGQGTYSVGNGTIVFVPEPGFRGSATPIQYNVADGSGNNRRTPLSVSVDPINPRAEADMTSGPQGVPQSVDPLANDAAGNPVAPLNPASLTLLDAAGQPATSVAVDGGEYSVANGRLVFTPERGFVGTPAAVTYRVADANGTAAVSMYTPNFAAVAPLAAADRGTARQGTAVTAEPLANDAAGDELVPLDPASLTLLDADGNPVEEFAVDGQGTYTVDRGNAQAPRLVFTPLPSFVGEAAAATYRVADANGTTTSAQFFPELVPVTPTAADDAGTARQGTAVTVNPLANDAPGDPGVPLDPATFELLGTDGEPADALAIDGQGTYTVDRSDPAAPVLVFTPLPTWVGEANAASYRVADANGTIATARFTPTITPVVPVLEADSGSARQGAAVSVDPLANDAAGDPQVPLDPASLTLLDSAGSATALVSIDGQGTYTVDRAEGQAPRLVFTPLPGFTGTATAVGYRVADANGTTAASTFTPTLEPVTPTAAPDVSSARQGAAASVAPLANDTPGNPGVPLVPGTLVLLNGAGDPVSEVLVPGQGRYTVNAANPAAPVVVFTPLPTFAGVATPATYQVRDANGTATSSTVTPTITAVTPTARPDAGSARQGAAVSVDPLVNDAPGTPEVPLNPASLTLLSAAGTPSDAVVVDGQGRYTVDRSNAAAPRLVFTPLPTFTGEATAVGYRIADANGTTAASTFTPTIAAVTPVAVPDQAQARQGAPATVAPLANDTPGNAGVPLVPGTLTLLNASGNPVPELVVAGQGRWTVDRTDPQNPTVTFTPEPAFTGTATVNYRVLDANGTPAPSTITAAIAAVTPVAAPDAGSARQGAAVSVAPLANDAPGNPDVPLRPETLTLLNAAGEPVTELVVDGQGTYTVDRTDAAAPLLVFTPQPGFAGPAVPAAYRVADANGTTATSTFTPTLDAVVPTAQPDVSSARQGAAATVAPLANDAPGNPEVPLVPGTLTLLDGAGDPVSEIVVAGQGRYTVDTTDPAAPVVVFTPLPTYAGTATPATYRVADANGTATTSTVTPTITAVTPTAEPDAGAARQGAAVSVDPLVNDAPGNPDVPLDPETLTLLDGNGAPVAQLAIAGQGTYTVDRTDPDVPRLVFTPLPAFTGEATVAGYRISDANGTTATSTFAPVIAAVTPVAAPDRATARQGAPATVAPLANDAPGNAGVPLDPGTFTLLDAAGEPVAELVVPGQGRWTVDRSDAQNPAVTFTPEPAFTGSATVDYRVADENGTLAPSAITAVITPVTPAAAPDAGSARQGAAVSADPLANDTPGLEEVPLDPETLTLLDGEGNAVEELVLEGKGTYSVDRADADAPRLVFTPLPSFTGTPEAAGYRVQDANGTAATSAFTPTITAVTPTASADADTTRQGAAVTVNPLANDVPGLEDVPLDPETLTLLNASGNAVPELVVAGQGRWSVDRSDAANPVVVFTPEPAFTGAAGPVNYQVADENGTVAAATITITVTAVTPVADPDAGTALQGSPVSVDPLANDRAGLEDVPLDPETLTLLDGEGAPVDELVVDGQGTYSVDRTDAGAPRLVFTPLPTFSGTADPVSYRIADANGTTATATFTPTLTAVAPQAQDDSGSGRQGAPVTLEVLGNDAAGVGEVPLDPASLTLLDAEGNPVAELAVPGQGRWSVDRVEGQEPQLRFTPEPSFTGTAAVAYRVADANGTTTDAVATVDIAAVTPLAVNDSSAGAARAQQSVDPLSNDAPGDPGVPLDPATLTLLDAAGAAATVVTVPGEGRYELVDGRIVFTPEGAFAGTAGGVRYQVADANGTLATARYVPTVAAAVAVIVDTIVVEAERGQSVTIDPGANVADLDRGTVRIIDANGAQTTTLVVAGEGVWSVDPASGMITFTPEAEFDGDPTSIRWTGLTLDGVLVEGAIEIRYVGGSIFDRLPDTGAGGLLWLTAAAALMALAGAALMVRTRRTVG